MKRYLYVHGCLLVAITLQGCAGTPMVLSRADQRSLQSLQLFGPDGAPQFMLYLACTSDDGSCITVGNTFSVWAQSRQINMRSVEPGDASFHPGSTSPRRPTDVPYRLAVRFAPLVVASYNKIYSKGDTLSGGYTPPKVSYTATLYVFDAATGRLLQGVPAHEERTADFRADATGYIRAEVNGFIAGIDPTQRRH